MAQHTCVKCGRTMEEGNFYTYKDGSKTELCKKCMTLHVNPFETDTFLWLLEKMDVPYVEEEWNILRDKAFAADPRKVNGTAIFGKYLSKMRLKQFKDKRWADTETLNAEKAEKLASLGIDVEALAQQEEDLKEKFEAGEISEAEYRTMVSTESQNKDYDYSAPPPPSYGDANNPYQEDNFMPEEDLESLVDLTPEEKTSLALKWGRLYKPSEWIDLEKKYTEMKQSFDIQDSDTEGTLILVCKTYLKMNQAIDCGDMEGFQKLSRVSESLRKSAKFTAAQNKEQKSEFVDSVGEMVAYCEQHGGQIPRYDLNIDLDIVDKVIKDLKGYTRSLIYEDTALADQIEEYIKKREIADQKKRDEEEAKAKGLDAVEISDEDFEERSEQVEAELLQDQMTYNEDEGIGEEE